MTSKTTYYAFDGTEFDYYEDCVKYENKQFSEAVKMWTADGASTLNIDRARIIYLPNEAAERAFVDMSAACGCTTEGMDGDGYGWYVYDGSCDQYFPVDLELLNTLFMLVSNEVNKIDDTAEAAGSLKRFTVDMKKIRSFSVMAADEDDAIEVACTFADENPEFWIDQEVDEFEVTPVT